MNTKQVKQDTLRFLGSYLLKHSLDALCKTLRVSYKNKKVVDDLRKQKQNYVLAFWHGTMLLPWFLHRNDGFAALTSKSKDGDLLAKQLKHWKYKVVRGSSSKGGDVALGIMVDHAKNGYSIAITPDGPRGPERKFKAGAVITAKKSGVPIVLMGIGIKSKKKLKSWDKFQIPNPFTNVKVIYSDLVYVDSKLSYDDTSKIIDECEGKLIALQDEAEKF
ncbi:MAG: lysophospholipid acyltransferase family protein [Ignavibacteriaceae bacterium]|nr:lysophospholipid acyltransferase family protein [Ignavibacterium sp.]MCC6255744.1 lysophospholipid acyltransferase family protein [Ignavibacteriaceae bacterium]HRN26450.1 lysophospholipid acyltransferase family protein [Ignavibacteriaceae bacterium]HRP92014.1 lysophospholipid acyltransferase family protein [Ignavibacteriaceae bacterium]HRQ53945.1 lysophospholipid acyltransferase family protein [Ignavibacteriaceae bacterium]